MKIWIGWVILAVCLGACGVRQDTTKQIERGKRDGVASNPQKTYLMRNENVVLKWGEVIANPNDPYLMNDANGAVQAAFMDAVSGLMEATLPVEAIGWVSGVSGLPPSVYERPDLNVTTPTTGVRFIGVIGLTPDGKQIDKNRTSLRIVIYDEFAGQKIDGKVIPEYPIFFERAEDAYFDVTKNEVSLTFKDEFGVIYMHGNFNQNYFAGLMSYDNFVTAVPGAIPAAGTLGTFQVPTCGILLEVAQCQ